MLKKERKKHQTLEQLEALLETTKKRKKLISLSVVSIMVM